MQYFNQAVFGFITPLSRIFNTKKERKRKGKFRSMLLINESTFIIISTSNKQYHEKRILGNILITNNLCADYERIPWNNFLTFWGEGNLKPKSTDRLFPFFITVTQTAGNRQWSLRIARRRLINLSLKVNHESLRKRLKQNSVKLPPYVSVAT